MAFRDRTAVQARAIASPIGRELAEELDRFLRGRTGSEPRNDAFFSRDHTLLWNELATSGWTTLGENDPAGLAEGRLDLLDLTVVAEAWGRHLIPLPLIETTIARLSGVSVADPRTPLSYVLDADDSTLIPFGGRTAAVVSHARDGSVELKPSDPAVGLEDRFAPSLPVTSGPASRLSLTTEASRTAAILTAAGAVGAATGALLRALDHARVRQQFGRPIGAFQAVKHRLANMHQRVELAHSALAWACADESATYDAVEIATDHCVRVGEDAIQVHGGIGFTWEGSVHWYLRHAMVARRIAMLCAIAIGGEREPRHDD